MDATDIIDELQRLERGLDWLAYELGVPVTRLARWIYGGKPIPVRVLDHIRRVLDDEAEGRPGRASNEELVLVIRVPGDKVGLLEKAAELKEREMHVPISIEQYMLGAAVEKAAADLSVRDDGSAWDYEQ